MRVFLGLDVGKSNLRVGVFGPGQQLLDRWSVTTADVDVAQSALAAKLANLRQRYEIEASGISIFGPLQVDLGKTDYGAVIESSEPAWSDVNIPALVAEATGRDVYFDFDVNAGALAEAVHGAGVGKSSFVYLSIGTGIGAVIVRGSHQAGFAPQIGHMYIPREPDDLAFEGSCRFHGPCLQGLASGKAMQQRWGVPAGALEASHPAWLLEARYIARACANLVYTFAPGAILLGSSVGSSAVLSLAEVNWHLMSMLNDFLEPQLRVHYAEAVPVIRAGLGTDCSLIGAALLADRRIGLKLVG